MTTGTTAYEHENSIHNMLVITRTVIQQYNIQLPLWSTVYEHEKQDWIRTVIVCEQYNTIHGTHNYLHSFVSNDLVLNMVQCNPKELNDCYKHSDFMIL